MVGTEVEANLSGGTNLEGEAGCKNEDKLSSQNCDKCDKSFKNQTKLKQHMKRVHMRIVCELCGWKFYSKRKLKVHTFEEHELEATKCPVCPNEFPSRERAMLHVGEDHRGAIQ